MANRYKAERKAAAAKARTLRRKNRKVVSIPLGALSHTRDLSEENARILASVQPAPIRWPRLGHLVAASILAIIVCLVYGHIAWHMLNGHSDSRAHLWF